MPRFAVFGLMTSPALLPVAAMLALILTLLEAVSVRTVFALQTTASFTLILPDPAVFPVLLSRSTGVVPSSLESAAPVISPPLAAMVKSCGSMSQFPYSPVAAKVVILASVATSTCAADVSMKPPLPPCGAEASSVPPTSTVPAIMPASNVMLPSCVSTVRASITPVLLTTLAISASLAPAVMMTCPPSARIRPPFAATLRQTL